MAADIAIFAASSGGTRLIGIGNHMVMADPGGVGSTSTVTFYVQNLGDVDVPSGALVYPDEPVGYYGSNEEHVWRHNIWVNIIHIVKTQVAGGGFVNRKCRLPSLTVGGARVKVDFSYTATAGYDATSFPSALACKVVSGADVLVFEGFDQFDPAETFDTTSYALGGRPSDVWVNNTSDQMVFPTGKPRGGNEYHALSQFQGVDYFLDDLNIGEFGYIPDSIILGGRIRAGSGSTFCAEHCTLLAMDMSHFASGGAADSPLALITGPTGDLVLKIWRRLGGGPRMDTLHTIPNPFSGAESEVYVEIGARVHGTWDVDWIIALNGIVQAQGTYNVLVHDTNDQYLFVYLVGYGQYGIVDDRVSPVLPDPDIWVDDFFAAEAGSDDLADCITGPVSIQSFIASANGALTDWPTKSPGTDPFYQYVDDPIQDKDVTYLELPAASTVPAATVFDHGTVPDGQILAVEVEPYTRRRSSPFPGSDFLGACGYFGGTLRGLSQTPLIGNDGFDYTTCGAPFTRNPWTLEAWETADVNAMQIGALLDAPSGISTGYWRITQAAIQVMLRPAIASARMMFGSISG